jgi:hypothetical protein
LTYFEFFRFTDGLAEGLDGGLPNKKFSDDADNDMPFSFLSLSESVFPSIPILAKLIDTGGKC